MKLSIITINYNNASGLEKTIQSIINQSYKDFEYIIIDGASTDNSLDIIKNHAEQISFWVSEPDKGIYNAMNKGIKQANGEYLLFINSGDFLYENTTLEKAFSTNPDTDIIYGNLHRIHPNGESDYIDMPSKITIKHMLENTLAHPVTFIKHDLFDRYGLYREDLKIVSDWAFFLKIIAFGRITQKHINQTISSFPTDGISNNPQNKNLIASESEFIIKEYFSSELLNICSTYDKYFNFYNKRSLSILRKLNIILREGWKLSFWKDVIYNKRIHWIIKLINSTVRKQEDDPFTIPIIIINYNRLSDLKRLIDFLLDRKHKNIVIIDNKSSYEPLLTYYKEIERKVTIKIMDQNYGHLAFWLNKDLYNEYAKGYYIITDSDIIPNQSLPSDYIKTLMDQLDSNKNVTKVGFALDIEDIPDHFSLKQKVIKWEKQFWQNKIGENLYKANIDTTFAIYPPYYKYHYDNFYNAIRIGGLFTAKHGGWYSNSQALTDEEKYYFEHSSMSNSWKLDKNGKFVGDSALYGKSLS